MADPVVITCAVTGSGATLDKHPAIPVTPAQIAAAAVGAAHAGAAIVHIHVRAPDTGAPSGDLVLYREVVDRIRDSGVDVILNLTTGYGARLLLEEDNVRAIAKALTLMSPEERVAHVCELKPEICSLDMGSMNFGPTLFVNLPAHLERMAKLIRDAGTRPELEVFEAGHVQLARHFAEIGLVLAPCLFQVCLGIRWAMPATCAALAFMRRLLPPDARWSAFGISSAQFPMVRAACRAGGNVRVGLEDNLYLGRGVLAPDNAALVRRAVRILEQCGRAVASPREARTLLGLSSASAP